MSLSVNAPSLLSPDGKAPELGDWEPPKGALTDYERLWLPTSDAPRIYHVACSLALLAAIVENKVHIPFGGDRIFPNLWVLILGPSSFFRKSSSIGKARQMLALVNQPAALPDEFSREALVRRLADKAQGLMTYSEFSGALSAFSRDYMSGTKEMLTDLYDCPQEYRRVVGGIELSARNVCISILAASQTGWFLEKLKAGDIRGGFMARFSFWPAFDKKRKIAVPPPPNEAQWHALIDRLQYIRDVPEGSICQLTRPALQQYEAWMGTHEDSLHKHPRCEDLSPFWSRLTIMALKFAMLLQLSEDRVTEIGPAAMKSALALTDYLKRSLAYLFAEEFAFTKDQQDRQRLLRTITKHPDASLSTLYRITGFSKREMAAALDTLQASEHIRLVEIKGGNVKVELLQGVS